MLNRFSKSYIIQFLLLNFLSFSAIYAKEVTTDTNLYVLIVWADIRFDEQSKTTQVTIQQKEELPKPFISFLSLSIATHDFNAEAPSEVTRLLESGLKLAVEIDPTTAKARILSYQLMPRPVRVENQAEPSIRLKGEWSGRVLVTCKISSQGRCVKPDIDRSTNAPAEMPTVIKSTIGSWRYVAQKQAGKAVEGEFATWVNIEADTTMPPKFFGKQEI
jgi:hypothetical protein